MKQVDSPYRLLIEIIIDELKPGIRTIIDNLNSNPRNYLLELLLLLNVQQNPDSIQMVIQKLYDLLDYLETFDLICSFPRKECQNCTLITFIHDENDKSTNLGAHVNKPYERNGIIYLNNNFFKHADKRNYFNCARIILHESCHLSMSLSNDYLREISDINQTLYKECYRSTFFRQNRTQLPFFFKDANKWFTSYLELESWTLENFDLTYGPDIIKPDKKLGNAENWTYFILRCLKKDNSRFFNYFPDSADNF